MRQPRPLPTEPPFLTLVTMTHLRPTALARNLASVGRQTAVEDIEQIVLPDHVGYGFVDALFVRIQWYAQACHGRYVVWLNDDDALADEKVVEKLRAFIERRKSPPVVTVAVQKGDQRFPKQDPNERPADSGVDLGSYVLRRDVWLTYIDRYGKRYAGDVDHAQAMWDDGVRPVHMDMLFATGPAGNGATEVSL